MIKRAAFALLLLSACAPAAAPPKEPEAPVVETPVAPAAASTDAEKYKAAPAGEITVASPAAGARVTGPMLVAEGSAINDWFFEGQFVAELVVDGVTLAQAPAMQAGDKNWTDPGPVGFKAELAFAVTKETNAELILSEDMPEFVDEANDIRGPARSVRIPVVLLPPAK